MPTAPYLHDHMNYKFKMLLPYLVICLTFFSGNILTLEIVPLRDSNLVDCVNCTLQYYLCNTSVDLNNTVIRLSPGNYTIDSSPAGSVCVIDNVHNFQLTSASDIATVTCQSRSVGATTGGILFLKGINISISNIIFHNCGGIVTNSTIIDNLGSFNNELTV